MNTENSNNSSSVLSTLASRLTTVFFYISILFFVIGFGFRDAMVGNWTQQFMPGSIGNSRISDITFIDSLTGWAVTRPSSGSDTAHILKTTNGGDNWAIKLQLDTSRFNRIIFLNSSTGFVCGASRPLNRLLLKTTNGGDNWSGVNTPSLIVLNDMAILNQDTIFIVDDNGFNGGLYRTTNGGTNWQLLYGGGGGNLPNKIYMFNSRIGFFSEGSGLSTSLYKTTNGGFNWSQIIGQNGFIEIYFIDSLTGWKTLGDTMKFTSNGGVNWTRQILPSGAMLFPNMSSFSNVNRDTIWGSGGSILYPNNQVRGLLFKTTNGGQNWLFQVPDTTIHIGSYPFINFINIRNGWAYQNFSTYLSGIHTTSGGDTTFLLPVNQINSEIPSDFKLFQNYPNPFNPVTNIKYQIINSKYVAIKIYDITGREITTLINQKQNAGTYQVDFDGSSFSSGVYFYSLVIEGKLIDTKKMILIK